MSNFHSKKTPSSALTNPKSRGLINMKVDSGYHEEDSADFQEDAIDEFEDYEQDEDSRSARRTESEKSFADAQKQRMTNIESRTVKKYRDTSVEERKKQAEVKHYQRLYSKTQEGEAGYRPTLRDSNDKYQEGYSPERRDIRDTDEFEGDDVQREFVKRTTNEGIEDIEVIVKEVADDDRGQDFMGNRELVDEFGNRYIYHDINKPFNTEVRAALRGQVKQEKHQMEVELKQKDKQHSEIVHKAKLDKIANKWKNRAFPYGTNYSKTTDADISEDIKVSQSKYKKITSELLRKACEDKRIKEDLFTPEILVQNKPKKGADYERLYRSNDKANLQILLAQHEKKGVSKDDRATDRITPNKLPTNHEEVTNRMLSYKCEKVNEMQKLHQKYKEEHDKSHQQFKPCKGSEKIVKTLFNKEKEYAEPAHERLHNNNKRTTTKAFNNVIQKTEIADRKLGSVSNPKIKYTTDLSNCIEINKRLGIDDLLPQKDMIKAAAVKKLEEEKKARQEFEEMIKEHKKQKIYENSNKSKLKVNAKPNTSKSEISNTSRITETRSINQNVVLSEKPAKLSNQSDKYLFNQFCNEFDENTKIILEEEPNAEILSKDHIRFILVKTGFIGNDINNIKEIENDEVMLEEIWRILKGHDNFKISPKNAKTLCGIIQGLVCPISKKKTSDESTHSTPSSAIEYLDSSTFGIFNDNGNFLLKNKQEAAKIQRKFSRLGANRAKFVRNRIKEKQKEKNMPTETFMPKINERSKKIDQRKLQDHPQRIPRYEILLEKGRMYNMDREQKANGINDNFLNEILDDNIDVMDEIEEINKIREDRQNELRHVIHEIKAGKKESTEQPAERSNNSTPKNPDVGNENRSGSSRKAKPIEDSQQNDESPEGYNEVKEEEYEESPNTLHELHSSERKTNLREDLEYNDELNSEEQMPEEDQSKQVESEYKKKGKDSDNKENKFDSPENEDQEMEGEGEGEGEDDEQSEQIPLLFVDVNLGANNTDRIVLYDGDNPADVAKEFSTRHNLDASMTKKLTDLLTQQMNGVLAKIVEEAEDDQ